MDVADVKRTFILSHKTARENAISYIREAPEGYKVVVSEQTRNLEQNAKMWACLQDVADQVDWYGQKLTPEEWKDIFSASLRKQKVVPGIDHGTFVVIGQRTSQMTKSEMSDMIELIYSFGAQKEVKFGSRSQ